MKTKIQNRRQYYGLHQGDFAVLAGLGKSTIQTVERGNRIRTTSARLIAQALDQPIDDLFFAGTDPRYLYPLHELTIGDPN